MRLKDKVALVTGAAGGIGSATAKRFAEEGAMVILSDINEEGCNKVLKEIEEKGGKGEVIPADLTREGDIVAMFSRIKERYGCLHILANIAGGEFEPNVGVTDITYEKMSYNIDANLKSCILCSREAARLMVDQKYGKIINMSSIAYRGNAMQITYSAAKGGISSFTRTLALCLGGHNINANAIAPALIETEIMRNTLGPEWEPFRQSIADRYPLKRVGQPIDVANCALFLASDESSFITGQIIEVSGGARL